MQYINLITGKVFGGRQTGDHFKQIDDIQASIFYKQSKEGSKELDNIARKLCRGKVINILGNGPSLKNFKPDENPTIGVNGCFAHHRPDILILVDCIHDDRPLNKFIRDNIRNNQVIMSLTSYVNLIMQHPEFSNWQPLATFDSRNTLDEASLSTGLFLRKSSVHAAAHLALMGGATEVRLFGVDYNDRSHYYAGKVIKDPKDQRHVPWTDYDQHVIGWRMLVGLAKRRKQIIRNTNAQSRLVSENIMPLYDCGISVGLEPDPLVEYCEDMPNFGVQTIPSDPGLHPMSEPKTKEIKGRPKWDEFIETINQGLKPEKIEV